MKFQALLLAAAASCEAHTIFQQVEYKGTNYGTGVAIRTPSYDGPQQDVTSEFIACNGGSNPTTPSDKVITVKAGDTLTAIWKHGLNGADVIDTSHKGPVLAYLKKVNSATTDAGKGDGWFKIAHSGYDGTSWAVDKLIANKGRQDIVIPSCIEPGQYLLRAEIIALHSAGSQGGAQFYMECAQLNITSSGTKKPASTVAFPGAYKATDPGILISIYYPPVTNYQIPGPAPFTC